MRPAGEHPSAYVRIGRDGKTPRADAADAAPAGSADDVALELLLGVEKQARAAVDLTDLRHLVVNETRKFNRARQIILAEIDPNGRASICAISAMTSIDPTSILVDSLCRLLERIGSEHALATPIEFALPAYCDADSDLANAYPFRELAWVPFLTRKGHVFAGMLMARESVWTSDDVAISGRLADTYAHAWRELRPKVGHPTLRTHLLRFRHVAALAAALALLIPVPLTALAPVEIVSLDPIIVSAPIDGVIEAIDVDPSAPVKAGDVLIRFTDTTLRHRRNIAAHEVAVANARVKQLNLMAFNDTKGRHEQGVAEAELELKQSELAYATDMLARAVIRAPRNGIAVYPDRKMLVGKPVSTGERLMEIAEPSKVEARIDVAATDIIALRTGGRAKLFLDVDPLQPWSGRITRADYKARPSDNDILAFRAFAGLDHGHADLPRIGLRGTAQIYGDWMPLAVVLLRRPISSARQWFGI